MRSQLPSDALILLFLTIYVCARRAAAFFLTLTLVHWRRIRYILTNGKPNLVSLSRFWRKARESVRKPRTTDEDLDGAGVDREILEV